MSGVLRVWCLSVQKQICFMSLEQKKSKARVWTHNLTFNVIGPVTELQGKNVIDWSAGVQRVGVPVVADESILPSQDQHGSVDQFQGEQFILTWQRKHRWNGDETLWSTSPTFIFIPAESLTASSWPFFLVQMYFPLLALSATLWPSHSTENMLFADLSVIPEEKTREVCLLNKCLYCDADKRVDSRKETNVMWLKMKRFSILWLHSVICCPGLFNTTVSEHSLICPWGLMDFCVYNWLRDA